MANFLLRNGVDAIIGGHPHVLQPMEKNTNDQFVAYSLGNFISNQRKRHTDGGLMVKLSFVKNKEGKTKFLIPQYYLTWVHIYQQEGKNHYEILPCAQVEKENFEGLDKESTKQIKLFIEDSRKLFLENNIGYIVEKK